jgi:hypothetical protein
MLWILSNNTHVGKLDKNHPSPPRHLVIDIQSRDLCVAHAPLKDSLGNSNHGAMAHASSWIISIAMPGRRRSGTRNLSPRGL